MSLYCELNNETYENIGNLYRKITDHFFLAFFTNSLKLNNKSNKSKIHL